MASILIVFQKIFFIAILILTGVLARKLGIITDKIQESLSRLLLDFFWPAMILSSFLKDLSYKDIIANLFLPVLALITVATGFLIALLFVKIKGYTGDVKKIFLYHGSINNFVFMVLPFVEIFIPGKGVGLLFIHNLGIIFSIWTLGVLIFNPGLQARDILKNLLSPGLIVTSGGILLVLSGLASFIPGFIQDTFSTLGAPSMAVSMLITGSQIYSMGKTALKFDLWNILLALIRLVLVPGLLLILALILKKYTGISREALLIFMLVNLMPVSLNSVSMAIRYNSDPNLAARGVVFTHLFSIVTIAAFLPVIEKVL